jgi:predicted nucleotidyltransferase
MRVASEHSKRDDMSETGIESSILTRLVEALVEALHPLRIVLFGSAARGDARPDSDIDLFVEVENGVQVGEAARKAYAAIGPLYPEVNRGVDIVVKDRAFVERYGDLVGTVLRPALREGKVLYAR